MSATSTASPDQDVALIGRLLNQAAEILGDHGSNVVDLRRNKAKLEQDNAALQQAVAERDALIADLRRKVDALCLGLAKVSASLDSIEASAWNRPTA